MYQSFNKKTASLTDRVAWHLCQIIDHDAPMRWRRYRFVAECIVGHDETLRDVLALAVQQGKFTDHAARVAELESALTLVRTESIEQRRRAERAEAEAAGLREDAERYRWIRSTTAPGYLCFPNGEIQDGLALGALDAAIDAARSAQGEGVG